MSLVSTILGHQDSNERMWLNQAELPVPELVFIDGRALPRVPMLGDFLHRRYDKNWPIAHGLHGAAERLTCDSFEAQAVALDSDNLLSFDVVSRSASFLGQMTTGIYDSADELHHAWYAR